MLLSGDLDFKLSFRFGSIAPGQHTPQQSLGDAWIPLAAFRGRADLLGSPAAMTAFGSSSHLYVRGERRQPA